MNEDTEMDSLTQVHHNSTTMPEEKVDVVSSKMADDYIESSSVTPEHNARQIQSSKDEENGSVGQIHVHSRKWSFKQIYTTYKAPFHFAIWAVWTA